MKIISGGQTGIDRAALDAAIEMGVDYGGWCPKGGWAEDFPKPPGLLARYPLAGDAICRADTTHRMERARRRPIDDLDRRFGFGSVAGDDRRARLCRRSRQAASMIYLDAGDALAQVLACTSENASASSVGIAGPRESEVPGIYAKARPFLCAVLARLAR